MRYRWVLLLVVLVAAGALGSTLLGPSEAAGGEQPPVEELLRPSEAESFLWPYTSRGHTTEQRTLAVNVVIVGSPDEVRAALRDRSELEWETAESDRGIDVNETLSEGGNASEEENVTDSGNLTEEENTTDDGNLSEDGNFSADGNLTEDGNLSNEGNRSDEGNRTDEENRSRVGNLSDLSENITFSAWTSARGAARYTYVADNASSGEWVHSEYQLATGTYLGSRTHIRAYPGPGDNWTALQAHTEYWDWFRLRHSVTGVPEGARVVERDLRDEPFVDEVSRVYHGHHGGGSDGWMTVIELSSAVRAAESTSGGRALDISPAAGAVGVAPAAALLAVAVTPLRRRFTGRDLALPVVMVALVLGVRSVGIAAENLFPATNPKVFAAILYPVLVAGPPAIATQLVHHRSTKHAGLLAAAGLGAGFVLDMGGLGVNVVPVDLVLQRTALIGAIGLLTHGVASEERSIVGAGLAVWVGVLAASLVGLM